MARAGSQAQREGREQFEAAQEGYQEGSKSGALSGASKGASVGATVGTAFGPIGTAIGFVGGGIVGAAIGAGFGGSKGMGEAAEAKKQEQDTKRRSDILARQTKTAMQQEARAASGMKASQVKAPPSAPSGPDAAMAAMPSTSGRGTAYDAWRSTVYGG